MNDTKEMNEIKAMGQIQEILTLLDEKEIARVLLWTNKWVADNYNVTVQSESDNSYGNSKEHRENVSSDRVTEFEDLASLYDKANPSTESERVLVVCYWLQEIRGQSDLDAQTVNSELKHMGYPVGNITRAFSNLMNGKPKLMMQVRKTGSAQQSRKKYKLTTEGTRKVKSMLPGRIVNEEEFA